MIKIIVGECKIGNTIIRCDDSCICSPEEVKRIRENLAKMALRQINRELEKEKKEE